MLQEKIQIRGREQRTGDGAGVIHRAVEAVDPAALVGWREAREHRVGGDVRIPLPRRSTKRRPSTCTQVVTNAMSGRMNDDSA